MARSQFVWWLDSVVFLINKIMHLLHFSTNNKKYQNPDKKDGQMLMVPLGKKEQETPVPGLNIRMH